MASKSALDGRRANAFWMDPLQLKIVGLDTPDGPGHFLYDERVHLPISDLMVLEVMDSGVHQVIDVVKIGEEVLVAEGRQRVRWAREANRRLERKPGDLGYIEVQCSVKRGDEISHARRIVVANEHRISDPPYMKAKKAQRLLDMGSDVNRVAQAFGVSVQALNSWLRLLELAPELQQKVAAGDVSATEALKVHAAPHATQTEVAEAEPEQRKEAVKRAANSNGSARGSRPSVKDIREIAEAIEDGPAKDVLLFVLGQIDEDTVAESVPGWPKKGAS